MSIYDTLNEQQKLGVITTEGPVLILAGAGSGKTRVLTHRTAYLIEEKGVNPYNIMAITFTNKAAGEMRERIDALVGYGSESIWVSTFHSTCVRILRRHIDRIGYDTNFTIYDSDDSKSVMKEICKRLNIDTKIYKERSLLAAISSAKDELVSPTQFALQASASSDFAKKKQAQVYQEYQAALQKNNALDFDDLIVKTVELLQTDPEVLAYYQERFRYIMVDEYQDTNTAQFELIRLLAGKYKNLCVVGDDDQSIYKFRGANIYNILNFEKHFPDAVTIKLEQNYRSTQNILNAANSVIANNVGRKAKTLWTANGEGEKIDFEQFDTAYEEAERIKKNAQEEGYRKGIEQSCGEIAAELATLRQSVEEMGQQLAVYEQETEDKIIKLTLDVAEKILTRRIEDDNTIIADIVEKAVLSERDKNDIIIHITDKSSKLVDNLEQRLEPLREKVSGTIKMKPEDEPPGYARIETEEGIIDVSVYTQLENLREQLALLAGKE